MESFSLQTYLVEMRKEQREDHQEMTAVLDRLSNKVFEHETRLQIVENTRKSMLKMTGAMTLAFIGAVVEMFVNHWKR